MRPLSVQSIIIQWWEYSMVDCVSILISACSIQHSTGTTWRRLTTTLLLLLCLFSVLCSHQTVVLFSDASTLQDISNRDTERVFTVVWRMRIREKVAGISSGRKRTLMIVDEVLMLHAWCWMRGIPYVNENAAALLLLFFSCCCSRTQLSCHNWYFSNSLDAWFT